MIQFRDLTINFDPTRGVKQRESASASFRGRRIRTAQAVLKGFNLKYTDGDHHVYEQEIETMNYSSYYKIQLKSTFCLVKFAFIFGVFCFTFLNGYAQNLADWQNSLSASGSGKGPESIPYSSLQSDAKSYQSIIDACIKDPWSCDDLKTKSFIENLNYRKNTKIVDIKRKQEQLYNDKSNATSDSEKSEIQNKIDAVTKDLDTELKEINFMETSLKTDFSEIDRRIQIGTRCRDARFNVQKVYANAVDKAKNENDPQIKAIAIKLIDFWEKGNTKHQVAVQSWKESVEKCEKCRRGDL